MKRTTLCLAAMMITYSFASAADLKVTKNTANSTHVPKKSHVKVHDYKNMIDINTATSEKLMTLPGITPNYAKNIIAKRPYRSKANLVVNQVIPADIFQNIRDKIVAMPPKQSRSI